MGKALCCGEHPVLISFTKIVLLAPFQPYSQLRAPELSRRVQPPPPVRVLLERSQPAS
ncbi:hypothetical protein RND71_036878 [Anisodus tanguticus]|uniref:Uncharacterized protein n=1 Tax=Anisodus tanguticus TaxID=243964 RepID=A0AAE1R1A2_9SOLA|nr:hypothetical protein RND71_036878 [Anisodus tanguticus]